MSETKRISITEALNELKLYDAKISKAVRSTQFIGAAKKLTNLIGVQTKETFNTNAQAGYQSVVDLIANRNKLKSAIVKSNAITEVTINDKTMTVAEAIERKNSIQYEIDLLNTLKSQYSSASNVVLSENRKVDQQIDKLLETFAGRDTDKKITREDQSAITEPYREKNEFELVDPLGLYNKIQELEADIDGFNSQVNTALVISNAVTTIEI
jgi:DNA repair exonuclease SbcCD nuclease subunit